MLKVLLLVLEDVKLLSINQSVEVQRTLSVENILLQIFIQILYVDV